MGLGDSLSRLYRSLIDLTARRCVYGVCRRKRVKLCTARRVLCDRWEFSNGFWRVLIGIIGKCFNSIIFYDSRLLDVCCL